MTTPNPNHNGRLLNLSTLDPDRPKITIDGIDYEMSVREDFGLLASNRLAAFQPKLAAGIDPTTATEEEITGYLANLDGVLRMVVRDIPDEILAKLREDQKGQILQAFFTQIAPPAEPQSNRAERRRMNRTGEKSSPDSSASTEPPIQESGP